MLKPNAHLLRLTFVFSNSRIQRRDSCETMPLHREPTLLSSLAKTALTNEITFRVRTMLHCGVYAHPILRYLEEVISSLAPPLAADLAQAALRSADLICERLPITPHFLNLLVHALIHDSTAAFQITTLHSYQLRQAVLNRMCELRHLQTYHCLNHFHENFNILATLQKMQSLSNLKEIFIARWCSDDIAHLLADSSPNLQILDAQDSERLTDSSVPSLSRCTRLRVLLVNSTKISDTGYEKLLVDLPLLQKIGKCDRLNQIILRIRESQESYLPLALSVYESNEIPDRNVESMCPLLTCVHLSTSKCVFSKDSKLPHRVTRLKLEGVLNYSLNTLLTKNLVELELFMCDVTQENITAIANTCEHLRVLLLDPPQLGKELRLVTQNKAPFRYLEEFYAPDCKLALDIIMVSRRIHLIDIVTPRNLSPFSFHTTIWTDAVLQKIMNKNPLQFLESLYLETKCNFSVEAILNFLEACQSIRHLGNTRSWGRDWREKSSKLHPLIQKQNLAVELAK